MAFEPGQPTGLGPAAVAVHDDADVLRHLARFDLTLELFDRVHVVS